MVSVVPHEPRVRFPGPTSRRRRAARIPHGWPPRWTTVPATEPRTNEHATARTATRVSEDLGFCSLRSGCSSSAKVLPAMLVWFMSLRGERGTQWRGHSSFAAGRHARAPRPRGG